ncbi:hypothetical protein INP83_12005 [Mucilaginibacter sp. 21P]|uniref:tetratricopeptide repeat-containing sensor histidine kinase n=1 Tax=Mucilaginibacter sp. 21P TaxID=2778902 RepID=UPI001C59AE70|nr:HAMP domain-containing sensor histidine kinase [Mucilaginibacter sp. 21P]QXV63830.1 hypothetical protein INP83_12005 [Mucilaginibacter sp. 21P]
MKEPLLSLVRPLLGLLLLISWACTEHPNAGKKAQNIDSVIARATELRDHEAEVQALALIDSIRKTKPELTGLQMSSIYFFLAQAALQSKNYEQANLYADSMHHAVELGRLSDEDRIVSAEAYLLKGDVLFAQGLYSYAFQYYYASRRKLPKANESKQMFTFLAHYFERQAKISYKQENFKDAITHYHQVLKELDKTDKNLFAFVYEKQGALSNLASSYSKLKSPDSALCYYSRAQELLKDRVHDFPSKQQFFAMAKGVIIGNMGDAWLQKSNFDRAERAYLDDIAINDQPGHYRQDALMTKLKLARLYLKTKHMQQAGRLLSVAGRSPVLADTQSKVDFLMTRADYEQATGQYQAALQDMRSRSLLRDSLQESRRKLLSANMYGIFRLMEIEQEKKAMENRIQWRATAVSVIAFMAVVIAILLAVNVRIASKQIKSTNARKAELEIALKQLEISHQKNLHFSDVLAHDLRNPIHAISTIITMMLTAERDVEDQEMLLLAKESIMKVNLIIADMLDHKADHHSQPLHKQDCDLAALLRHSVALLRFKAGEKNQKIQKTSVKELHTDIDQHKIWRVFNNLLVNAIKFSPSGATIWVDCKQSDQEAVISIKDEGIGIPEEIRPFIFSESKAAQRSGTTGEKSYGIGLPFSREIVEAHGGKITFYCPPEGGTVFTVTLPLR